MDGEGEEDNTGNIDGRRALSRGVKGPNQRTKLRPETYQKPL